MKVKNAIKIRLRIKTNHNITILPINETHIVRPITWKSSLNWIQVIDYNIFYILYHRIEGNQNPVTPEMLLKSYSI